MQKYSPELYMESIRDVGRFWGAQAEKELVWMQSWNKVLEGNTFFSGGKLNVSFNCLDRHVPKKADTPAIIWRGEADTRDRIFTFQQLFNRVNELAALLLQRGIKKGDVVTIYLPQIPEVAIAMLACARIGAVHSVVFSGFSASALAKRISAANSKMVITCDQAWYAGKRRALGERVESIIEQCPSVRTTYVFNRKDLRIQDMDDDANTVEPVGVDANDPLFILHTSGSTGEPKEIIHRAAGYLLYVHTTYQEYFDTAPDAVHWCTADAGWITGHSYGVYGPLSNGVPIMMYEGAPNPDSWWKFIEDYNAITFYTAPTAIRFLRQYGDALLQKYDLGSLRVLGSVGEPIDPTTLAWYAEKVGRGNCSVVDTWFQTETGGIMIAGKPSMGIEASTSESGELVITKPWPAMTGDVPYLTGDRANHDREGNYEFLGRIDDVMNIAGHRVSATEVEDALTSYPGVFEAAVISCPDLLKGEAMHCFVVMQNSPKFAGEAIDDGLRQHVREEVGAFATPKKVWIVPELPKTRSGKIVRRLLKKLVSREPLDDDLSSLSNPDAVAAVGDVLLYTSNYYE